MGKYRTKEIVDADRYTKGMEDGHSCMVFNAICTWQDAQGNYKQCKQCTLDIPKCAYVESIIGLNNFSYSLFNLSISV